MKVSRSLRLLFTGDSDAAKLFEQTLDRAEDAATVVAAESSGQRTVVAGAVGVPLPLGGITTAGFILIASDKDIVVRLNGGTENVAVKKATSGRGLLFLEGAITSIVVDNPGAENASVLYALAGV